MAKLLRINKSPAGILFIVSFVLFSLLPFNAQAQESIEILEQQSDYLYDGWLHFSVRFSSPENILEGFLLYQLADLEQPLVYEGELGSDQSMNVEIALTAENKPKPFTEIQYWYRFSNEHNEIFESQSYSLYYSDNRYSWQTIEKVPFTLHWHDGGAEFAAAILAAAEAGINRAKNLLPLDDLEPVVIWVYDNAADVRLIADQAGFAWQAGHTDPAAGLILLSLPPGPQQSLEIQRQVPHEIAHLMMYQTLGAERYGRLPTWLVEGLASSAEIYSDPARNELLELAQAGDRLIPFYSLCNVFPQGDASARLAYAQSAAFIEYLHSQYGTAGLATLVDAYAETGDCMNAPVASFGIDLIGLESQWRASLTSGRGALAWINEIPWIPIVSSGMLALLLFFGIRFLMRSRHGWK